MLRKSKSGLGEQLLQLSHIEFPSTHAGQIYWIRGESKDDHHEESQLHHLTVDYSQLREDLLEYVEDM